MDKFWIQEAYKYISTHPSFKNTTQPEYLDEDTCAVIYTEAIVNLPSRFIEAGKTDIGVKCREPVRFQFHKEFPNAAPKILLRDDFPRSFPHINPSCKDVLPCIYEGDLSELLQQPEWMNAVLNQLIDWFEKAASNSLLNYAQGWEPMRIDRYAGIICYNLYRFLEFLKNSNAGSREIRYKKVNDSFWADCENARKDSERAILCVFQTNSQIDKYIPNMISNLAELYHFTESVNMLGVRDFIENKDKENIDHDFIFCVLAIRRPCNIIRSDRNIEFLNFIIHKSGKRKKGGRNLKRVLPECKVDMLYHISPSCPELLKKMSGSNAPLNERKTIALLGCGSVGSKIGLHLARNGNNPFLCIDKDIFLPHNNARHGLSTYAYTENKASLLSSSISHISGVKAHYSEDAFSTDYSGSRIIIDSTASFAVRNFLIRTKSLPPKISVGLYHQGEYGLMLQEGQSCRLCDLWAYLYLRSIHDEKINEMLFSSNQDTVFIGQSCSSITSVVSDDVISSHSASFSHHIQNRLENMNKDSGEVILTEYSDGFLAGQKTNGIQGVELVSSHGGWNVRVLSSALEKIKKQSVDARTNETGGVLVGTIFLGASQIVISDILPPPKDSTSSPYLFKLGTEGLQDSISSLEKRSCGKVTYLGTWHSHPHGGTASETDIKTMNRLSFLRNYEPTICLIWKPGGLEIVSSRP